MNDRFFDLGSHLISGVLDNSVKGKVTGQLIINGLDHPLQLDLQGNALPDLAGCVLKFSSADSWPVDPWNTGELLENQTGIAGTISGSRKADSYIGDDQWTFGNRLVIEWFNFELLFRFIIERGGCKMEMAGVPAWRLTGDEIGIQQSDLRATETVFDEMCEEFEEDLIDEEMRDQWFGAIDSILPKLEAAEGEETKLALMREALGPDVSDRELDGLYEAYFVDGGDWEKDAFPKTTETPRAEVIPLDDELRGVVEPIKETVRLIQYRIEEKEEAPPALEELVEGLSHLSNLMLLPDLLDFEREGPHFEPCRALRLTKTELERCGAVISYLELEGNAAEKRFCDVVWPLRDRIGVLIGLLEMKKPKEVPGLHDCHDCPF